MKQLDERVRASEGDNLGGDLIAPAHASTRVPGAVVQHTPGPWVVESDPLHFDSMTNIAGPNGEPIAQTVGNWPTMEGNARLIAAAPELLAALEHMIGAFEPIPMNADYYEFEKEAIERARAAVHTAKNPV